MPEPTEPRIVPPEEAQGWLQDLAMKSMREASVRLTATVATEYERRDEYARVAVVKALREFAEWVRGEGPACGYHCDDRTSWEADRKADAIKNGAPL